MNGDQKIQEDQYEFPYHFIPEVDHGAIITNRFLQWSMVYMGYITMVRDEILKIDAKSIIDVGCGDGRVFYELEKLDTSRKYHGIDVSDKALKFANAFTEHSSFQNFDIIEKPYPEKFDLCAYIETIEHIPPDQIKSMIGNIAESLNKEGILILTTPTTNLPTAKKHYQHFTKEKIQEYIGDHFEIKEVKYLNVEGMLAKTLARILVNKLFITQSNFIRRLVFSTYKKYCLIGKENTGSRIYVKAVKR